MLGRAPGPVKALAAAGPGARGPRKLSLARLRRLWQSQGPWGVDRRGRAAGPGGERGGVGMVLQQEAVDLGTPSGPMRTYVYRPVAPGRYPGLVLYSEIFQRTAPVGRIAATMAGHGYLVAVPEIFHDLEPAGTELAYDQPGTARGNRHKVEKPVDAFDADTRAVVAHLAGLPHSTGRVGAMGVCVGGHLAFRAALEPTVRAAACFYATDLHTRSLGSGGDDSLQRAGEVRGELLMIWGRQDPHIPAEGRAQIYRRLTEAGVAFTWHEFNAAHAFMRDEGPRSDPALALASYRLAVDLFGRTLGGGDPAPPAGVDG
jgi:carboxymethylenebutenolidase